MIVISIRSTPSGLTPKSQQIRSAKSCLKALLLDAIDLGFSARRFSSA